MKYAYAAISLACLVMACSGCHNAANDGIRHEHSHGHEGHGHEGHGHEGHDHEGHDHEGHDHEGHDHESAGKDNPDIITLSPQAAERLGVGCTAVEAAPFGGAVRVAGSVAVSTEGNAVATAPSAGTVTFARDIQPGKEVGRGAAIAYVKSEGISGGDPNRVAKAELDAATAEYRRVSALYADRLVTLAEFNAAKAALDRAKAAYSPHAASGAISSPIAGIITSVDVASGQYVNAGEPVATISADKSLTIKADVPVRDYKSVAGATDARIISAATGADILLSAAGGRRISGASGASASGGFVPVYFSLPNDGSLLPGTSVDIYVISPDGRPAITVDKSALVEQQGAFFVFERLDEDCYRKVPVVKGRSDGRRVEILSGLAEGMQVVTSGATAVKLAQSAGAVPAGHSHSH